MRKEGKSLEFIGGTQLDSLRMSEKTVFLILGP
jgi:hypothetical protein